MKIDDLVRHPGSWLSMADNTGCVISSRIRMARNIKGHAFPGWAGERESVNLLETVRPVVMDVMSEHTPLFVGMADIELVDKQVLMERHIISSELAEKDEGSGVVIAYDESESVMINEEDHLRLQVMSPGMDMARMLKRIDDLDSRLEKRLDYAFSPRLGYLTACPSNVGTGLRASVMLHLPALRILGEIDPITRGLNKIGLTVRGLLGEGTEPSGDFYQVSNQTTLGESEEKITQRLTEIVKEVTNHESNARKRLFQQREHQVRDFIGRSYGNLKHSWILSSREALDLLSGLRLGVEYHIIENVEVPSLNELLLLTQPGHLQKLEGKILVSDDRDLARARIIREKLQDIKLRN